jgi:hypothetical protein
MILWTTTTTDGRLTIIVSNGFGTGDVSAITINKQQNTLLNH